MPPKRDQKSGKFKKDFVYEKTTKTQNGGVFAPGAFLNMGNAMQNIQGAAPFVMPAREESSDSDSEDEELEAMKRLAVTAPQAGGMLGIAAAILAINPNFYDQIYQFLNSIGLEDYTEAIGTLASRMLTEGMFQYQNSKIIPTAAGKQTIQSFVHHMLGQRASAAVETFITTRLAALFNFEVRDGEGELLYPAA